MKLYRVVVSGELYVLANSPTEAQSIAIRQKISEVDTAPGAQVHSFYVVPNTWKDAFPFGGDDQLSIRDLFDRGEIET